MKRTLRNGICRIDVIPEGAGAASVSRGTGFLVGPNLILTALHVVADRRTQPPTPYPGKIQLQFPEHKTAAEIYETNWDPKDDWVLLRCETPPPGEPLRLAKPPEQNCDWLTFGFPDANPRDGMVQTGSVEDFNGTLDGSPAYQLFSRQAAAGRGAPAKGLSGGPVIIGQQVVGILRFALMKEGETVAGTLYGCPVERPATRLPQLLKLEEPQPPTKWEAIDLKWRQHRRIVFGAVALMLVATIAIATMMVREKFVPAMLAAVPFRIKAGTDATKVPADLPDLHASVSDALAKRMPVMDSNWAAGAVDKDTKEIKFDRLVAAKVGRVLQGEAVQKGGDLQLFLRVINPSSGRIDWSGDIPYDGSAQMPSKIVRSVLTGLKVPFQPGELEIATAPDTHSTAARAALLRGNEVLDLAFMDGPRTHLLKFNAQHAIELHPAKPEDWAAPEAAYKKAIEADPNYAAAHARLAQTYIMQIGPYATNGAELRTKAGEQLGIAGKLKPNLADVHVARGHLNYRDLKYTDALKDYKDAQAVDPNNGRIAVMIGLTERMLGHREQSKDSLVLATTLNPANWPMQFTMAVNMRELRHFPEAEEQGKLAVRNGGTAALPHVERAVLLAAWKGDLGAANAALRAGLARGVSVPDLFKMLTLAPWLFRVLDDDLRQEILNLSLNEEDKKNYAGSYALARADMAIPAANPMERGLFLAGMLSGMQQAKEDARKDRLPLEPWFFMQSAVTHAAVGMRAEALKDLDTGDAMAEGLGDAISQMWMKDFRVIVSMLLGNDQAETLKLIEDTLKRPSNYTAAWFRVDPFFAPLRTNPEFVRLTAQ